MTDHLRGYCLGLAVGCMLGIALTMAVVRLLPVGRCPEPVRGAERVQHVDEAQSEPVYITL